MYKLTEHDNTVQRLSDSAFIPFDRGNRDYREYLEWLDQGNTPDPYVPPPPPVPQMITRRQCAIRLRELGMITPLEARNMTKNGDVPAMVMAVFSQMTEEDMINAETDFAADSYLRTNPLLIGVMQAAGKTEEELDDFFRTASEK